MIAALREGWIVTQRDLKHWVREPWTPILGIAFSVMLLLVFGFLFGGAIEVPGGGDYLDYLLPGMFTLSMMFGVEATMLAVAQDTKRGITDRFRSMPISSVAVPLGRCGADLLNSAVQLVVLMVGGLLVGWRIDNGAGHAMLAVALLLWLRFAMLWIGIYLGVTLRGEGAQMAVQVLIWPLVFLSNVFVAPETMPALARLPGPVEPGLGDRRGRARALWQPDRHHRRRLGRPRGALGLRLAARPDRDLPSTVCERLPQPLALTAA